MTTWRSFIPVAALAASIALCGCENSSGGSDAGGGSGSETLADQTVSIPMGADHQTGVITAPGDGTLNAHVKSLVASLLSASFIRQSDSATTDTASGSDFTFSTTTTSGQTWRVSVHNPSGVAIDTQIVVTHQP